MKTIIKVSDMSCGHCVKAVTNIISDINGVEAVEVSLENENATIEYSDLDIQKVVDNLIQRKKKIDILSYSRNLVKRIQKSDIGKSLENKFGELNLCISYSLTGSKKDVRFQSDKCNIGTNFKSGVNISKLFIR